MTTIQTTATLIDATGLGKMLSEATSLFGRGRPSGPDTRFATVSVSDDCAEITIDAPDGTMLTRWHVEPGSDWTATVSLAEFADAVKGAKGEVELIPGGEALIVKSERKRHSIPMIPNFGHRPFQAIQGTASEFHFRIRPVTFRNAVKLASPYAESSFSRYNVDCVLFDFSDSGLQLVATDSRRLLVTDCEACETSGDLPDSTSGAPLLVNAKRLDKLSRIIARDNGDRFCWTLREDWSKADSEDTCAILEYSGNRVRITLKCPVGRFPQWRGVIPEYGNGYAPLAERFTVDRAAMLESLEEMRQPGMQFLFNGDIALSRSARVAYTTRAGLVPEDVAIRLDSQYVAEYLAAVPDKSIEMIIPADGMSPALMIGETSRTQYVVMPLSK